MSVLYFKTTTPESNKNKDIRCKSPWEALTGGSIVTHFILLQKQYQMNDLTQILPHAEDLAAHHHSHVSIPALGEIRLHIHVL